MNDRTALLLAWLEGEEERQRRPILPPPQVKDLVLRGWVQVGVCVFAGALASALIVCWLFKVREQAARLTASEELRLMSLRMATGDPEPPVWTIGGTAKRNDDAFGMFVCGMVLRIAFGTVIGAVFLLVACAVYNKLVGGKGSPSRVPEPPFGKAMGITFATALVHAIGLLIDAGGTATGSSARGPVILAHLLSLPISLVVMAGMNSALLPTTFARGLVVALCYLLVGLVVVVVLTILFGGLFLVVSLLR